MSWGIDMVELASAYAAGGSLAAAEWLYQQLEPHQWWALGFSLLVPILLVFARNGVRLRRLKSIYNFSKSYSRSNDANDQSGSRNGLDGNPSMEFVTTKYSAELLFQKEEENAPSVDAASQRSLLKDVQTAIQTSRTIGNRGDIALLVASLPFAALSYLGFTNLFDVIGNGMQIPATVGAVCPLPASLNLCVRPATCPSDFAFAQLQIVGSLAFAGAYIASLRNFLRSLAVFDLSAFTFLRLSAEMLASVLIVLVLYRAFPDPTKALSTVLVGPEANATCGQVPWMWIGLAVLLGLLPESATKFLIVRFQSLVNWIKVDDDRFVEVTRSVSLDTIDGIDFWTRFRLEECGIYDVQNLATYNPIQLHIEAPYGIYQTIDWVAQAQLCALLGLDRFLMLRELHVRTILDLERAIDFNPTDASGKREIVEEFDLIFAAILFAPTRNLKRIAAIGGLSPLIREVKEGRPSVRAASIDDYCAWAMEEISRNPARIKPCVEYLLGWMCDDLHVRRLRRIWQEISASLGKQSERLDREAPKTAAEG